MVWERLQGRDMLSNLHALLASSYPAQSSFRYIPLQNGLDVSSSKSYGYSLAAVTSTMQTIMWPNFTSVGFTEKREERKGENGFNYSQIKQSTKTILVFHFILSYFNTSFFPPSLSFFSVARLGRMLVSHVFAADQGQAGNTESVRHEPTVSSKS